jgi:DnaK suppressor protein
LLNEIQSKVRDVRDVGSHNHHHSADLRDTVEAEPVDDLVFALIQMRAETLERVNEAVRHCEQGTYGYCVDCDDAIAPLRLRALPFAVRCLDCEETREDEQRQERVRLLRVRQGAGRSRDVSDA